MRTVTKKGRKLKQELSDGVQVAKKAKSYWPSDDDGDDDDFCLIFPEHLLKD